VKGIADRLQFGGLDLGVQALFEPRLDVRPGAEVVDEPQFVGALAAVHLRVGLPEVGFRHVVARRRRLEELVVVVVDDALEVLPFVWLEVGER